MEKTFIAIKPDAVQRGLTGEVLARFERRGFKVTALKMTNVSRELAEEHYAEHKEKPFFGSLVDFLISSPVVAIILEAPNAVKLSRSMIGATKPEEATAGTIRGDYTVELQANLIHGSDSSEAVERELKLWFPELEN
ncbi:MAG: nucleoside-diphosphate kinase [Abditibacteriaceae bacterium]